MTQEEFLNHVYHTRTKIHIPVLKTKIDKEQFVTKRGYDLNKQNEYLKKLYKKWKG